MACVCVHIWDKIHLPSLVLFMIHVEVNFHLDSLCLYTVYDAFTKTNSPQVSSWCDFLIFQSGTNIPLLSMSCFFSSPKSSSISSSLSNTVWLSPSCGVHRQIFQDLERYVWTKSGSSSAGYLYTTIILLTNYTFWLLKICIASRHAGTRGRSNLL